MNSLKIELGFGIQKDKDNMGISRDDAGQAIRRIKSEAARLFGAYTLVPTSGGWTNGSGRLVEEDGYTLFTMQSSTLESRPDAALTLKIKQLAGFIKSSLNQEAVALTYWPVDFETI